MFLVSTALDETSWLAADRAGVRCNSLRTTAKPIGATRLQLRAGGYIVTPLESALDAALFSVNSAASGQRSAAIK